MLKELGGDIRRKYLTLLAFRTPFEAFRTIVSAFFLKMAFDAIGTGDERRLAFICLFFVLENVALFAYNGTIWRFFGKHYAHMQGRLKLFIMKRLLKKDAEEIDALSSGDILIRINQDAEMAMRIYGEPWNLVFLLNGICNLLVSSVFLYFVSAKFFFLVFAFVVPHVFIDSYLIAPAQGRLQKKIQAETAELTDMYTSYINMADVIQLYGCGTFLLEKTKRKNDEIRRLNVRKAALKAVSNAILPLFGLSGYLVVMLAGADMISAGLITYGTLLYVCQFRSVLPAAMMIIKSITNIQVNRAGITRIKEFR